MAIEFNSNVQVLSKKEALLVECIYEKIKIGDKVTVRKVSTGVNSIIQGYVTFISIRGLSIKLIPISMNALTVFDLECKQENVFVKWHNFISLDEQRHPDTNKEKVKSLQKDLANLEIAYSMSKDDLEDLRKEAVKLANALQDIYNLFGEDETVNKHYKLVEKIVDEYKE